MPRQARLRGLASRIFFPHQRSEPWDFRVVKLLELAGGAALLPFGRPAFADTYPSRVVRLFVGFPPGGGADLATRIVANGLSEIWRQQVIVENRPGAGARIALDTVAHAPADGYQLLLAPGSPLVQALLFSTLTFDPATDFAPVSLVGTYPNIIVVPNASPFHTLGDLIAHAKAHPGAMSWASPGIGSVPHLAGELFRFGPASRLPMCPIVAPIRG